MEESVKVESNLVSLVEGLSIERTVAPQQTNVELKEKQEDTDGTRDCIQDRSQLDEVLVEALRVPRDRIFVLLQEKDMEERIRRAQEESWELPLMNSYQRLLVHRIADHFRLAHSIDATTKAVTLTRQSNTDIPEISLSNLATVDMERLSESVYTNGKDNSVSGFKIMRREGAGRSDSPRDGLSDAKGLGRDRRNMTIEEREAAYKEARQRIFGCEEANGELATDSVHLPNGDVEAKGLANLSLEVGNGSRSESRKGTPGRLSPAPSSTSSSSSAAFLRAGAPTFDPNQRGMPVEPHWQAPVYGYPLIDINGNHHYPYQGGFVWPQYVQHDVNGRQIIPAGMTPLMSATFYPYPTPGSSSSNVDERASMSHSPSVSSRSTSVSVDTEGDGGQSSVTRNKALMDHTNNSITMAGRGRPHSISPSASFQQSRNGNNYQPSGSSNGSSNSGPSNLTSPHVYQGQVPVPASWNQYTGSPMTYPNRSYQQAPMYSAEDSTVGRNQTSQRMGYAAALANSSRGGSTIASSSSSVQSTESTNGYLSPGASSSSRKDDLNQNRSRNGTTERSLFDPNKPIQTSSSNENQNLAVRPEESGRTHSINKSNSAAGLLEGRPKNDSLRPVSTSNVLPTLNSDIGRRLSSMSDSPHDVLRRVTPPSHPSLPARPDWAISTRNKPTVEQPTTTTNESQSNSTITS